MAGQVQGSTDKKVMLVTGASRGIGAAIARLATTRGWRVGVNYHRSAQAAQSLVEEIRAAGGDAVALQADVSQSEQVRRLFRELDEAFGRLDSLVNNAGVLANFPIAQMDEHMLADVFAANVFSAYYCAREAALRMSRARGGAGGAIVNISSIASRTGGRAGGCAYAGSKGAIDAFNLSLAKELGPEGIRVNAIRPGLVPTEIHNVQGGIEAMRQQARATVPLGREGEAREIAEAVLWLAGEQASYVHGAVLDVAGGR